jgi:hypothetical protein
MRRLAFLAPFLAATAACSSDDSPVDPPPPPPVLTTTTAATPIECPHGGSVVRSGADTDRDGVLDAGEVAHTTPICGDEPGGPPPPVLVRLDPIAADPAGCPHGGTEVLSGPDGNGNGVLDDAEIAVRDRVCTDAPSALLSRMVAAAPGACAGGGITFEVGRDGDGDGMLADDEVEVRETECSDVVDRDVVVTSDADAALLAHVRVVTGALSVRGGMATALALPALVSAGSVEIAESAALTAFTAPVLATIDGTLSITETPALRTIDVPALRSVGAGLRVEETGATSLASLRALASIGGDLDVKDNPALTTIDLDGLVALRGDVWVAGNDALTAFDLSIPGHDPAQTAVGEVRVGGGAAMTAARVVVYDAPLALVSIGGPALETIETAADRYRMIYVSNAPALKELSIAGDTADEVHVVDVSATAWVAIGPSATSVRLFRGIGGVALPARVDLLSVAETNLPFIDSAVQVGMLSVQSNPRLRTARFGSVMLGMTIFDNTLLEALTLSQFTIEDQLTARTTIDSNPALTRVDLAQVHSISYLEIARNPRLATIDASRARGLGGADLRELPALRELRLDRVASITSSLHLTATGLTDLGGLASLATVGNFLSFVDNTQLPACQVAALFARVDTGSTESQSGNDETATCD